MSTLLVYLTPDSIHATEYDYVLCADGQTVTSQASTSAALLPAADEIVAVVAASALSWQSVQLPKGSLGVRGANPTPRLRAMLEGLLEERLLDEPHQLHFALAPDARANAPVWVAVCERAWLKAALQDLETAGRAATRIVPEFAPEGASATPVWQVLGTEGHATLVRASSQGVLLSPLGALPVNASTDLATPITIWAEPAVAALAEECFKRPVLLQQSAQRWLAAAQSEWDLAQFDLASSGGRRTLKRLGQGWQSLLHARQWRALRWGAGLLVAIQLLGLNLWAWHEQAALQAQRAAVNAVLTQTFPGVRVVVDAPAQMQRELARLRQATGTSSGADLETLLAAVGAVLPANRSAWALEFSEGTARLTGLALSDAETAALGSALKRSGYGARNEAQTLVLQAQGQP